MPWWILLIGGLGIVVGLATYGWKVISTVGRKITELTPSRGFAAELGAAATVVFFVLHRFRSHPYMSDVVYVWDLKQQLNRIHRKLRYIEAVVENNDHDAMIIMNFMYRGSRQLYELDDNTITMDGLISKISILDQRMENAGLSLSTVSYNPAMLSRFSKN